MNNFLTRRGISFQKSIYSEFNIERHGACADWTEMLLCNHVTIFVLTDEVQNPNKTRQLFLLAYQLAKDLIWVFSVLKLELMKPLLLMVFYFGHGSLSRKGFRKVFFKISNNVPKSLLMAASLLDDFEIPLLQTQEHHFQIHTRSQYLPKYIW